LVDLVKCTSSSKLRREIRNSNLCGVRRTHLEIETL
ncbi:hypothetical protein VCHC17A1_3999B, partial [Vibrio cholerae HC-17A1]